MVPVYVAAALSFGLVFISALSVASPTSEKSAWMDYKPSTTPGGTETYTMDNSFLPSLEITGVPVATTTIG